MVQGIFGIRCVGISIHPVISSTAKFPGDGQTVSTWRWRANKSKIQNCKINLGGSATACSQNPTVLGVVTSIPRAQPQFLLFTYVALLSPCWSSHQVPKTLFRNIWVNARPPPRRGVLSPALLCLLLLICRRRRVMCRTLSSSTAERP